MGTQSLSPITTAVVLIAAATIATVGCRTALVDDDPADGARPIHERIDLPSIAACGGCHADVYEEWSASLHHGAWTNENVRVATREFQRLQCRSCHSPMPVLPSGLDRRPGYRAFNQHDGVHCLSCHGLEDGVAAARTIPDAPCRPRFEPRLLSADMCYPCHEPTHQAFEEYRTSDAHALGVRCVDCHMQPTGHRRGRSHGPNGGMNAEFVKRALGWRCEIAGEEVLVELRNRCGHKFPGEIPSRSFLVRVEFEGEGTAYELLRKPHRGEDRDDDRLLPDEVRVLRFAIPEDATAITVSLLFKPLPLIPDDRAFVVGEWQGERRRAH